MGTTSRQLSIEDPALCEQLDYYRARAGEYDQWWLRQGRYDRGTIDNRRWFDDARTLEEQLARFKPVFHQPDALQARLAAIGWNMRVEATGRYFIHGHGSPCT